MSDQVLRARTGREPGRVLFIGAVHEAEPAFQTLLEAGPQVHVVGLVTAEPERAERLSGYVDLATIAARHGVPVLHTSRVNDPGCVDQIAWWRPDLIVVVGWSQLIGPQLLALPRRGCVGFHASMLPHNRGRAPVNWAIIRGETHGGNTMMYLAPEADTGDIIAQRAITIRPDDTCASIYAAVAASGAQMLRELLPSLLAGTAPRRPQDPRAGNLLPKRTPAMGITDWSRPARAVHDWIRAQTLPYPGAFGILADRRVMLWRSAAPQTVSPPGLPGRVLDIGPDGVRVGTGLDSILLTEAGDPGEPAEPAVEWFSRNGFGPGARFDPVDGGTARWALGHGGQPAAAAVATAGRPA